MEKIEIIIKFLNLKYIDWKLYVLRGISKVVIALIT